MKKTLLTLALTTAVSFPAMASDWATYKVTVTNASNHQVLTPPLVVTHSPDFSLFSGRHSQ